MRFVIFFICTFVHGIACGNIFPSFVLVLLVFLAITILSICVVNGISSYALFVQIVVTCHGVVVHVNATSKSIV
jgi:hypothetical protein